MQIVFSINSLRIHIKSMNMKRYFFTFFLLCAAVTIMAQPKVYTPTLKSPTDSSTNEMPDVTLTWNAITGSTNLQYQMQLDTTSAFTSTSKIDTIQVLYTGYKTKNLLFGKVYYWRVRAIDNGETSFWSPTRSFTIFNNLEVNKPSLTDTAGQVPDVAISWKNTVKNKTITGVTNYDYQIDTTVSFNSPLLVGGTTNSSTFSFQTSNLRFNTIYYWRVRAKHSKGVSDWPAIWSKQNSKTSNDLHRIYFSDANTGYAIGNSGTIIKTTNAGTKWTAQVSGTTKNLNFASFPAATSGYVVGDSGTILKTANGGTAWTKLTSNVTKNLNGVHFMSATVGFAVGDSGMILKFVSDNSWQVQASGTGQKLSGVFFQAAANGFAVGDSGKILKFTTSWGPQVSGTGHNLKSVYFANATTGFIVGDSGTILKTTNGGSTWSMLSSGTTNNLKSVYFSDAKTGFAAGSGGTLLKTVDGGIHWMALSTGVTGDLYTVHFPNSTTGFAAGQGGLIINSALGGIPWSFKVLKNITPTDPANASLNQFLDVTLKWNKVSGLLAYGYMIAKDPNFTNIVFESEIDTNFVKASFLMFGTQYYWRVKGRHLADTTDWSPVFSFTTINTVLLKSPANNETNVASKPILIWNTQTGIIGYQLQLDSTNLFNTPIVDYKPAAKDVQYQVSKKLNAGKVYYWRMRAFSDGGLTADTTAWCTPWSFTVVSTGIEENSLASYSIYPNPAKDRLYIKLDLKDISTVQFALVDLLGKVVLERNISAGLGQTTEGIDLSQVGKGIYIGRLTCGSKVVNQKVIIEK
jgi:photosystem II stability/assembly factor-like uncharacterized protein